MRATSASCRSRNTRATASPDSESHRSAESTPPAALLRVADLWYADWTATVDGARADVLKADYLLRAVAVPAGRHRVAFRFESRAVRAGLFLSLASLAAVLALLGADALLRR